MRLLLVVLAAGVLLLGIALLLRADRDAEDVRPRAGPPPVARAAKAGLLAHEDDATTRAPLATTAPAEDPRVDGSTADRTRGFGIQDDQAILRVDTYSSETGNRLGGVPLVIHLVPAEGSPDRDVDGKSSWRTNGLYYSPVPAGHDLFVTSDRLPRLAPGRPGGIAVPALAPGELREVELAVPSEPDIRMIARVVESESGRPLARAALSLRKDHYQASRGTMRSTTYARVFTDADGFGVLTAHSWNGLEGCVEAPDRPPLRFPLVAGHETPDTALVLALPRAAEVRGVVLDEDGLPNRLLRIELRAELRALRVVPPETSVHFLPDLPGFHRWITAPAADGSFHLEGLPPEVPLEVTVTQRRTRDHRPCPPLVLAPGEVREVTWRLGTGGTVHGLAVLDDGEPAAFEEIWLVVAGGPRLFHAQRTVHARARTDEDGAFRFSDVTPGRWLVGPGAVRGYGDDPYSDALAPLAVEVDMPAGGATRTVRLVVHRGVYVTGIVRDPDGVTLRPGAHVSGRTATGEWITTPCDQDGAFALGPLPPGPLRIDAVRADGSSSRSEPVTVRPGDADVVLTLRPAGRLAGHLAFTDDGAKSPAWIEARPRALDLPLRDRAYSPDGHFAFAGLVPGTYDLFAWTEHGGIGTLRGVRVTEDEAREDLVLPIRAGARLHVHGSTAAGGRTFEVRGDGGFHVVETLPTDGTPVTVHVPPGDVTVHLLADGRGPGEERVLTVRAGEDVEVPLTDANPPGRDPGE